MNLRKSRYSFEKKRSSRCKSFVKMRNESPMYTKNKSINNSSKKLSKCPKMHQKLNLNDSLMDKTFDLDLVTSTPIPRKVIKRKSVRYDLDALLLNSPSKQSRPVTSTPIQTNLKRNKSCEVKPIHVKATRKSLRIRKSEPISSNNENSDKFSHVSPVKVLRENRSKRSSIIPHSGNALNNISHNVKVSQRLKYSRNISMDSQKHISDNPKKMRKLVLQNAVRPESKRITRSSTDVEELASLVSSTSQHKNSGKGKVLDKNISSISNAINNNSFGYSLRNCSVLLRKSDYLDKDKQQSSAIKSFSSRKSYGVTKEVSLGVEIPQYSQSSLSELHTETSQSSSSGYSLRLRKQNLSQNASDSGLPFNNMSLSHSQNTTKSLKDLSELSSKNTRRSSRCNSLQRNRSSKKIVNKSSSQSSVKKTFVKKPKLAKKVLHENTKLEQSEKSSSSPKKQKSSKKSDKNLKFNYLNSLENATIDDLASTSEKRKSKSDGFKTPSYSSLKRKKNALAAVLKANAGYEDDLYEHKSHKFEVFKDLLMDISDSETSFAIPTPKFPFTPLNHEKTPKIRDIISPTQFAERRKAAIEYNHSRKQKRKRRQKPETPVAAENKKLEFSQALEDVEKFQKTIESMDGEDSDGDGVDSYFSFC